MASLIVADGRSLCRSGKFFRTLLLCTAGEAAAVNSSSEETDSASVDEGVAGPPETACFRVGVSPARGLVFREFEAAGTGVLGFVFVFVLLFDVPVGFDCC